MRHNLMLLLLVLTGVFVPSAAQETENVIIVTIDGIRNDEAFEAESLYLRHVWNDLRPLGTIYRRFWNRGWTATTSGHTTILSGVRQILNNNGGADGTVRSFDPLVFEYFREYLAEPEASCGVAFGKTGNFGAICDYGLEPAFGARVRGSQWGADTTHDDTNCLKMVFGLMDSVRPRLMLINLACVDGAGHTGVYEDYLEAIRVADSVVFELYKRIQAIPPYEDTSYRNRTLYIVTTDHGRNDDAHSGFKGHGEWDHGCRDLMFWALGPGVRQGAVIDSISRDQIDIAPTVGAVLGFPTPFAEGELMAEMFEPGRAPEPVLVSGAPVAAQNLSSNPGFSRDPDLARDRYGNLHLVWSDNTRGRWLVYYSRSTDDGMTWSMPRVMFDFPAEDSVMWYARVAADDSLAVAASGFGRHACYIDSVEPRRMDSTFLWYPWMATSTDQGGTWTAVSLFDSSMGMYYPGVAVREGRYSVAWWICGRFGWQAAKKGLNFNSREAGGEWDSVPERVKNSNMVHIALRDDGEQFHVATCAMSGDEDADILYFMRDSSGGWLKDSAVSDPLGSPVYDHDPELVVDESGMVHLFWQRKPDQGGVWRLMYGRRDPGTGAWDTLTLVSGPADACQPHAALKGDTLALVWTDYRGSASEVYCCFSTDLGLTWTEPEPVTTAGTLTQHPRVSPAGEGFFVVWQSLSVFGSEEGRSLDEVWDLRLRHLLLQDHAIRVIVEIDDRSSLHCWTPL